MKRFSEFRLYEFEEKKMTSPEQISFMDNLYQRVKKEILPKLPRQFKADYDRGKSITIHTDNKKDLSMGAKISDDKMVITTKPVNEPAFEMNFNFESAKAENILNILLGEFEKSETNGLYTTKSSPRFLPSYQDDEDDYEDEGENDDKSEDEQDDIDIPITHKPRRIKRSIDIKIIKEVLEDAYILEDIDLKTATIEELIRRMLTASRRK